MGGFYLNSEKGESTPQTNLPGKSNISVSTFYKHIRTPPPSPPPSISISHLRQFTSLYSPPLYLYFQHLYISDPIVFLSRAFLSNIFQENKFEGAKDTVFQSYTENLETLKKKKRKSIRIKI